MKSSMDTKKDKKILERAERLLNEPLSEEYLNLSVNVPDFGDYMDDSWGDYETGDFC